MVKRYLLASLVLLTLFMLALAGCLQGPVDSERQATAIVLPEGDPEDGRRVMSNLGCALCHRANGDHGMPEPASTTLGPVLGPIQASQSTEFLVESILSPSHRLPEGHAEGAVSPMVNYQDITIRQLADVVAYIRYLGE